MNDTVENKPKRQKISEKAGAGNALIVAGLSTAVAAIDFSKVKAVRAVAVPVLSLKGDNVEAYITITSPIAPGNADKESGKPVFSCKVRDLTDGVEKAMVTPAIIKSELTTTYPNDTYVGKSFALRKEGKAAGKRYNMWQIVEIDISEAAMPA